jgi:hypothetical protein
MPHAGFGAMTGGEVPEDQEIHDEIRAFLGSLP